MVRHPGALIALLVLPSKAREWSEYSKNGVAEVTYDKIKIHSSSTVRKVAAVQHQHLPQGAQGGIMDQGTPLPIVEAFDGSSSLMRRATTPVPTEMSESLHQSLEVGGSPAATMGLGPSLEGLKQDNVSSGQSKETPTTHKVWMLGGIAIAINVVVTLAVFILLKSQKPVAASIAAARNSTAAAQSLRSDSTADEPQVEYPQQQQATAGG